MNRNMEDIPGAGHTSFTSQGGSSDGRHGLASRELATKTSGILVVPGEKKIPLQRLFCALFPIPSIGCLSDLEVGTYVPLCLKTLTWWPACSDPYETIRMYEGVMQEFMLHAYNVAGQD